MSIIIGGSSSSGSSLLQNILNRHSKIYCGPETSIFAKRELYTDWVGNKGRVLSNGIRALRNPSWFLFNGLNLFEDEQLWSINDLHKLIENSRSFPEFTDHYFNKFLVHYGKSVWIEKTPTNAINFDLFLNVFPNAKVIHMLRNPYDTITSLTKRGYHPFFAAGIYLCNVASGLYSKEHPGYYQLKYEDLVNNPELSLRPLCKFLNLTYEDEMLDFQKANLQISNTIEAWNYDADKEIGKGSINSFEMLDQKKQDQIIKFTSLLELRGNHRRNENTFEELCISLDYTYFGSESKISFADHMLRFRDMLHRTIRTYPTHIFNYPVRFK